MEILRDLRLGKIDAGGREPVAGRTGPAGSIAGGHTGCRQGRISAQYQITTQTAGRAARNVNGLVIMYADKVTESMQRTIDETERRRAKQLSYNAEHGIVPRTVVKSTEEIFKADIRTGDQRQCTKALCGR